MIHEALKEAALKALSLLPNGEARDEFAQAIRDETPYPRCRIKQMAQWITTGQSQPDEEWWERTRYAEITYVDDGLTLSVYQNTATMICASQQVELSVSSKQPFEAEEARQIEEWGAVWRQYSAAKK